MTGGMLVDRPFTLVACQSFLTVQQSATAVAPTGVLRKTYFMHTIIRNHECKMEGSSTQDHLMSSASHLVGNFSTFLPHLGHTNREVKPEVKTMENLAKNWLTWGRNLLRWPVLPWFGLGNQSVKKLSATCIHLTTLVFSYQKTVPTKCQCSIPMMHHDAILLNTIPVLPGRARGGRWRKPAGRKVLERSVGEESCREVL